MDLNKFLAQDDVAVWNQKVDVNLEKLPIYLQKDSPMRTHHKKLHTQPGIELNITHEGSATFVVGNSIYRQTAKHVILFPGNYPHQVFPTHSTNYGRTVLCLNDILFDTDYNGLTTLLDLDWFTKQGCKHFKLSNIEYVELLRILNALEKEFREQKTGWQRMLFSYLLELVVILQRKIEREPTSNSVSNNIVDLCSKFVDKHIYEDLSLQRVADLFAVSAEHLTRSFRKQKGISYYQYVLLQRVLESKHLLCQYPNKSLTEIAYSLGFSSSSQFSRTFKMITKVTPSDYRRKMVDLP